MPCLPHLAQPWHFEVKEVDWEFSVLSKQKVFYSTKSCDEDDDVDYDYDLFRGCLEITRLLQVIMGSIVRELQF